MIHSKLIFYTKSIRYFFDNLTYRFKFGSSNESLKKYKDIYKGKPLLIVGNGPSLNCTPLDEFCYVPSIGMNKIELIFKKTSWRPSIVICVNNLVIKQFYKHYINSTYDVLLSWKSRFFIPRKYRSCFNYFLSNSNNSFSNDPSDSIGSCSTVTYAALQLAHYTGADPIIIVGVDHSFTFKGQSHDIKKMNDVDKNHFDPNYFAKGQYWGIPNLEQSEIEYKLAKDFIEASGTKIYDATVGGKLNVFDKISIEDAIKLINDKL